MVRRDIREDRSLQKIVTRFLCVGVRLLFLMTFHLEFQRIALWHGKFQKSLLTSLQVISQLFELLLSCRCGFSRAVFIISNINIIWRGSMSRSCTKTVNDCTESQTTSPDTSLQYF